MAKIVNVQTRSRGLAASVSDQEDRPSAACHFERSAARIVLLNWHPASRLARGVCAKKLPRRRSQTRTARRRVAACPYWIGVREQGLPPPRPRRRQVRHHRVLETQLAGHSRTSGCRGVAAGRAAYGG